MVELAVDALPRISGQKAGRGAHHFEIIGERGPVRRRARGHVVGADGESGRASMVT
jgi:hypothetical protein